MLLGIQTQETVFPTACPMTQNPPEPRPIVVYVDFAEPLDSEAYLTRFRQESGFRAIGKLQPRDACDLRLSDRCPGEAGGPATVLVTRRLDAANSRPCLCCQRTGEGERWRELLERLAKTAGREHAAARLADDLSGLTRRELDVLCLVGQGKTVGECAESLGVAPSTVGNHKYRLMRKLGVTTSLQLLRIAVRHGLAEIE